MTPSALNLGVVGLGTVGSEVVARLITWRDQVIARSGTELVIRRIVVRDPDRARDPLIPARLLSTDLEGLLTDPEIHIVVELMGGEEPARTVIERAITSGKHVVTANKVVIARHGADLLALAARHNVEVFFEAAVGGGIPIVDTLKVDVQANEIERIAAIINGTTNFVLTRMASAGLDYEEALREAQAAGYAEADPTDDVSGSDAAHKLAILGSLAFNLDLRPDQVGFEGITRITSRDFAYAAELGCAIKLIAYAERHGDEIDARVHPLMVPLAHPLAQVDRNFNAVYFEGDLLGPALLYGQGAGGRPTASAVIGDLIWLANTIRKQMRDRGGFVERGRARMVSPDRITTRGYYRILAADQPGVIAAVGTVFADLGVSISSVIQKATSVDGAAELVVTTHPSTDRALTFARARLEELAQVRAVSSFIRMM